MKVWIGFACLLGLVWLVRLLAMWLVYRRRQVLGADAAVELNGQVPKLSIIVAAKDEEGDIEACVRGLLAQDYPDFEVIAVNDRSEDRTPAILDSLEAEYGGRLRVIHVTSLRDGWFGKNNAMREGIDAARGDWFCMTDADCKFHSPRTMSIAVSHALERGTDFLSIAPVVTTECWWERVLQPVCGAVLIVWFLPERVNNPKYRTAYANGAFMLMNRHCYDSIGGHAAFKTQVNEDIHMARAAKASGLRLRVVENDGLYSTRMYASLRQAIRGWSRIFYGSLATTRRLAAATLIVLISSLFPWIGLLVSAWAWSGAETDIGWSTATYVWGVTCGLQVCVMALFYPILRIPPAWALTYPIGSLGVIGILIRSILQSLGAATTTWRGTTYRGDRLAGSSSATVVTQASAPKHGSIGRTGPAVSETVVGSSAENSSARA